MEEGLSEKSILQEIKEVRCLRCFRWCKHAEDGVKQFKSQTFCVFYKELRGCPPPKGMLQDSEDWFMACSKFYSSMFDNSIFIGRNRTLSPIEATGNLSLIWNNVRRLRVKNCLGLTRAWTLLRYIACEYRAYRMCLCGGDLCYE